MSDDLSPDERESVANAAQLIREAGWKEKADLLDDMLQLKHIVKDNMDDKTWGSNHKDDDESKKLKERSTIKLNPKKLKLLNGAIPLKRTDPNFMPLVGTLHHEIDHSLCHDELACFGDELALYKELNQNFDKYFPGVTAANKKEIEKKKKEMETESERVRKEIARRGGAGYGTGYKKTYLMESTINKLGTLKTDQGLPMVKVYGISPDVPDDAILKHMDRIADLIYQFYDKYKRFPKSGNSNMVKDIVELYPYAFDLKDLNNKREMIDIWGNPYVYKCPGEIYEFDLLSLGPEGKGGDQSILCLLHRR